MQQQQKHQHQPHIVAVPSTPGGGEGGGGSSEIPKPLLLKKLRGSYNCGRCGLPKRGHICHLPPPSSPSPSPASSTSRPPPPPRPQISTLRRALSFDDFDLPSPSPDPPQTYSHSHLSTLSGRLPLPCLWEVLRRLPPTGLLAAAMVCKGWRDTARRLWRAAEELRLAVPSRAPLGFVGSLLNKCPALVRLTLRMERLDLWGKCLSDLIISETSNTALPLHLFEQTCFHLKV